MPAHREIGSAGTSAGDAEYRLVGKGGASPIYGAMKARAKISPKPNIRPLMKGKPILMATTAVNRRARRFHERPCEKMKESVSSPVGAGGKGGLNTNLGYAVINRGHRVIKNIGIIVFLTDFWTSR